MAAKKVTSVWSCNHLQGVEGADDVDLGWTVEVRCTDGSRWYHPAMVGSLGAGLTLLRRVRIRGRIDTARWVCIIRGANVRTEFDILMHGGE